MPRESISGKVRGILLVGARTEDGKYWCTCTECGYVSLRSQGGLSPGACPKLRCTKCPQIGREESVRRARANPVLRERARATTAAWLVRKLESDPDYSRRIGRKTHATRKRKMEEDAVYANQRKLKAREQARRRKQSAEKWAAVRVSKIRATAASRGLECSIDAGDITWVDSCPILGIPLTRNACGYADNCASVDRIDNSKGYIKGNVWVISHKANMMKGAATIDELRRFGAWAVAL